MENKKLTSILKSSNFRADLVNIVEEKDKNKSIEDFMSLGYDELKKLDPDYEPFNLHPLVDRDLIHHSSTYRKWVEEGAKNNYVSKISSADLRINEGEKSKIVSKKDKEWKKYKLNKVKKKLIKKYEEGRYNVQGTIHYYQFMEENTPVPLLNRYFPLLPRAPGGIPYFSRKVLKMLKEI